MKSCLIAFVLISFALCVVTCKKDNSSELPLPTQTGQNTFGCKINGKVFRAGGTAMFVHCVVVNYNAARDFPNLLRIDAQDCNDPNKTDIYISPSQKILQPGTYKLHSVCSFQQGFIYEDAKTSCAYPDDSANSLIITRLDTVNHIVSGQFSFTATDWNTKAHLEVTEGRFDFKYPFKQ